ncbi:peroxiredoxin-2-like isoform X2 [Ambystoma mexicanum]|uniref:peroxiredoxin-2-like isoform X2 n=1 Tax=Ambystoma mexicanum TaxID=8296 RepID=UPI0037E749D8
MTSCKAQVGRPAPDFKCTALMPDGQMKEVKLCDYKGKYLVFFFYPMDFSQICPFEITEFSDHLPDFRKMNCEVAGISVDSYYCHEAWTKISRNRGGIGNISIPLLSDPTHAVSQSYGVLKCEDGVAFRGLFIIDKKGILRQITINDLPVKRSVQETLRLVQAFQTVDSCFKEVPVCVSFDLPKTDRPKKLPSKEQEEFDSGDKDQAGLKRRICCEALSLPNVNTNLNQKETRTHLERTVKMEDLRTHS